MSLLKRISFVVIVLVLMSLQPLTANAGDYVIGEGDGLAVSVWGADKLNFSAVVRPDGKITVPGYGDVVASSFTPADLAKELTVRFKDMVKNPIVTVTVANITNSKVYVFGGGVKPGVFDVIRKTTLLQLLCSLDLKSADLHKAHILRHGKKVKQDFSTLFQNANLKDDILMEADDVVFIPVQLDRNIYVLGEVGSKKSVEYREGITVLDVILEAGWFTQFADMKNISIIRREAGKEGKLSVNVKSLINKADLKQNIRLSPGDYLIVDESIF